MAFKRKKGGLFESNRVIYVPVTDIFPNPAQPRTRFAQEGLRELADSIQEHGILQPLSVRRREAGGFELISGERRLRAARLAELKQVPCIIVSATDVESSLLALVENLQRRDLDYVEEAAALQQLIATYHLSQEEAARRIGKSQSAVANKLRLLKLSPELLAQLREHDLSERHARALLRLEEGERQAALTYIVAQGLNVAQTDSYIDSLLAQPENKPVKKRHPVYIKDIRLFLNSLNRGLETMKQSGLAAVCGREETEEDLILTIRIPKKKQKAAAK
ncbi:MAG: ParB/RepB/Spo0J family partition protein [Clostridiales bacterium]|nr:ParB/RepB/Spo0J family partition protein [Clostridiales bacterium]